MSSITGAGRFEKEQMRAQLAQVSTNRMDWAVAGLSVLVTGGAYLDGWAHNHNKVDETFFTPWHAVLYAGVFAFFLFLLLIQVRNQARGASWQRALPAAYRLSFVGSLLFLLGGLLDLLWHTLFGIEVSLEALLSPTHLLLVASAVLMAGGPLRAAWQKRGAEAGDGWKSLGPRIFSLAMVFSLLTFITQFAHPFVNTTASRGAFSNQALGVASILLQAGLLSGVILLAVLLWKLPFGALTLLIFSNAALMSVLRDHYELLPAALAAGLLADLLRAWLKPGLDRRWQVSVFAFAVPAFFYSFYFLALQWTAGLGWSLPVWLGSICLAGSVGLLLGYLAVVLVSAVRVPLKK